MTNVAGHVFTVGELTGEIKKALESGFKPMWLKGELSGVHFHRSGHLYLTLKDNAAQISGVMWRSRVGRLDFRPEDGTEVLAFGRLVVYEKGGRYQFDIDTLQPAGRGALAIEFEKLKARLTAEGLFEESRKRPLPRLPKKIGVITSPSGAAVRDILVTLNRRGFDLDVLFVPAKVQGDGAAEEVAAAINAFGEMEERPDVLIVGRGGGSIEDLWAFNEEILVRAVADSPIPVISGVGHETDFTLVDFAADLRAPTPTGAAERATPDKEETSEQVRHLSARLERSAKGTVEMYRKRLELASGAYGLKRIPDRIAQHGQNLDELDRRMAQSIQAGLRFREQQIDSISRNLDALSPRKVMERGYSVVLKGNKPVTDTSQLEENDSILLKFARGSAESTINKVVEP